MAATLFCSALIGVPPPGAGTLFVVTTTNPARECMRCVNIVSDKFPCVSVDKSRGGHRWTGHRRTGYAGAVAGPVRAVGVRQARCWAAASSRWARSCAVMVAAGQGLTSRAAAVWGVWGVWAGVGEDLRQDGHRGRESGYDGVPVRVRKGLSGRVAHASSTRASATLRANGHRTARVGHGWWPFDPAGARFSWSRAAARSSRGEARNVEMNCSGSAPSSLLLRRFAGTGWRAAGWVARCTACRALIETWA